MNIKAHITWAEQLQLHNELVYLIKKKSGLKVGIAFDEAQIMACQFKQMYVKPYVN
jgi:hypothetical protein